MRYAILRCQKLKAPQAVRRSLLHAFREQPTPNADPAREQENTYIGARSTDAALAKFNDRLPDKVRKNAVLAVEYLITASPEAMQGKDRAAQDAYFDDAMAWLRERHGADNVFFAGIHRDETTPHLYAYAVPLDERGKLNCRAFLGGAKALSDMQTDFAQRVGRKHGLERGVEHSRATHTQVREFYGQLAKVEREWAPPPFTAEDVQPKVVERKILGKDVVEAPERVAERLSEKAKVNYAPALAMAATAATERRAAQDAKRARAVEGGQWQRAYDELKAKVAPFVALAKEAPHRFRELVETANRMLVEHRQDVALKRQQQRGKGPEIGGR